MTHATSGTPSRRALFGLVVAWAVAASACSGSHEATPQDARQPVDVEVQAAALGTGVQPIDVGGEVRARTTATLVSKLFAEVRDVLVAPGDKVRAGQVLLRLDARDLQAQRAQAESGVVAADQGIRAATSHRDAADAGLVLATATHRRIADLRAKNSATPNELDQAVSALKAAQAQAAGAQAAIQQAQAAAEAARAQLRVATVGASYAAITAPFDGVVTEKKVEVGNMATPGSPLLTVEDDRSFRLEVRIDEARAGEIDRTKPVDVTIDAMAKSGPAATQTGVIAEVSRAMDAAHAFLVKIDLPANAGLRSGMFGRARITGGTRQALTVPASAVVRRGQLTSVFVVGTDHRARLRLVQVGPSVGTRSEIAAGLDAGEQVVVQPPASLVDGATVRATGRAVLNGAAIPPVGEVR